MKLKLILLSITLLLCACSPTPYYSGNATVVDHLYSEISGQDARWHLVIRTEGNEYFHVLISEAEWYSNAYPVGDTLNVSCNHADSTYCRILP